jgi:hypothetical protein
VANLGSADAKMVQVRLTRRARATAEIPLSGRACRWEDGAEKEMQTMAVVGRWKGGVEREERRKGGEGERRRERKERVKERKK